MRRPNPALIVSILALVMATAGTATAAKVLITSTSQIKEGSVNSGDVRDGALRGRDVRDGTLGAADLSEAARSSLKGAGTPALEAYRKTGPTDVAAQKPEKVATLSEIPPGAYAIFAKTIITAKQGGRFFDQGTTIAGHCQLDASGDRDDARGLLGAPGANSPGSLQMQITRTFKTTGTASLTCDVDQATWTASDTSIIAIRLAEAPRTAVDG